MATETAPKTARPERKRAPATAKATVDAVTTDEAAPAGTERITFELEMLDETKTYTKFAPPKSSGCVGTLYVPKGTQMVKVLLQGSK